MPSRTLASPSAKTLGTDLNKQPSSMVVIDKGEETSPRTDSPCPKATLALPNLSSACPPQTLVHHLSNNVVESSSIEGEGRLLYKVVNKNIMIGEKESSPVPDKVLPLEPCLSRIEVPERSSQCSMLKDHQVPVTVPSIDAVNTKRLPNSVAISIKSS
jgi:hypothetical protein